MLPPPCACRAQEIAPHGLVARGITGLAPKGALWCTGVSITGVGHGWRLGERGEDGMWKMEKTHINQNMQRNNGDFTSVVVAVPAAPPAVSFGHGGHYGEHASSGDS